ncbi:MAG: APC family permease [Pseudonocardia sp.]|uniref:APC family permease n=1 Tax=unclassified Pseudonocardia TaxID=2619320 RepID=UPI00086D0457|nr:MULTISPECIES: APC family permease [unclassified Pseudonocardia]MBN9111420.1 APC family permease [Pseudonocardia sp.]ODU12051.1 MAG: amino acid transporter [Pseudonocardia sp. SCN 72-51]ODV05838.1 MAG: amino acid transporter [Pseudonocardia sp. SCN 73-27]
MSTTERHAQQSTSARGLTGSLGVGSIVFMVVAAAAPLTVIAGTVPLGIAAGNGPAFPTTFALCCVILLLFAVGFCAMSRHVPNAGAFYAYIARGLGRATGTGAAFLALVTYTAVQLAVYGYIGAVFDGLVQHWGGPALPWWLWSIVALAIVAVLGYRHIELSSRVLGTLLIAEVAIVLVLDVVVIGRGGGSAEGLSTALVQPSQVVSGSLGIAIMFAIASFLGFEATAVFRNEARDPQRTIPRATYTALLVIGVFYTLSSWSVVSAWGDTAAVEQATADPGNMLITTITNVLGPVGGDIAQVLLVTSMFAALLSFHNVLARYFFSLGGSGALPAACGRSHPHHRSPHIASATQSVTALVFVAVFAILGMDPVTQVFAWMAGTATLGVLALMALTCAAVIVFFRREHVDTRLWQTVLAPSLGLVGLLACLWLTVSNFPTLIGGSPSLATAIGAVLVLAFVFGLVWSRRRPATPAAPTPSPTSDAPSPAADAA